MHIRQMKGIANQLQMTKRSCMLTYLRSHDNRFALIAAFVDDDFLEDRHVFGGAFDSQISTGHHDTIAKFHNLFERVSIKA